MWLRLQCIAAVVDESFPKLRRAARRRSALCVLRTTGVAVGHGRHLWWLVLYTEGMGKGTGARHPSACSSGSMRGCRRGFNSP